MDLDDESRLLAEVRRRISAQPIWASERPDTDAPQEIVFTEIRLVGFPPDTVLQVLFKDLRRPSIVYGHRWRFPSSLSEAEREVLNTYAGPALWAIDDAIDALPGLPTENPDNAPILWIDESPPAT